MNLSFAAIREALKIGLTQADNDEDIAYINNALAETDQIEATLAQTTPPTIWLAYRVSFQYGGAYEDGETRTVETLLDADTNVILLTRRLNAYFADPKIVQYERGNKIVIPAFALKSNTVHGSGGGCSYNAHVELRKVKRHEA